MTIRLPPAYISQAWAYKDGYMVFTYKQYIIARNARKDIIEHDYDITIFDRVLWTDEWNGIGDRNVEKRYYY